MDTILCFIHIAIYPQQRISVATRGVCLCCSLGQLSSCMMSQPLFWKDAWIEFFPLQLRKGGFISNQQPWRAGRIISIDQPVLMMVAGQQLALASAKASHTQLGNSAQHDITWFRDGERQPGATRCHPWTCIYGIDRLLRQTWGSLMRQRVTTDPHYLIMICFSSFQTLLLRFAGELSESWPPGWLHFIRLEGFSISLTMFSFQFAPFWPGFHIRPC